MKAPVLRDLPEPVEERVPWAGAKVGSDVLCWFRGRTYPLPAKIIRIDIVTGVAVLVVFWERGYGVAVAPTASHRSVGLPQGRQNTWDFTA